LLLAVDISQAQNKTGLINESSETGSTLQIHIGSIDGPVVAEVNIPKSRG